MTFSIIARDSTSGCIGIAIASRFFAVGAICPFIFPSVGAILTQASGHPPFGPRAGQLLRAGTDAPSTIEQLLATDEKREHRQLQVLDRTGRFAGFTGAACVDHAGYRSSRSMSVAGNMLASPAVLDAAVEACDPALPLAPRLLAALEAAHRAGGDKRGQQAAAILVYGTQEFPLLSLRVDDDEQALQRLATLYDRAGVDYIPYMREQAPRAEIEAIYGS